ncbi:MAG: nitrate reductase subunit beta, partial [Paracoccaceae bacterium]|nr:nitrate reductase subunit beta [Paracoccaceae bacterium]
TAGDEEPVVTALERMLAMRSYMRSKTIEGVVDEAIAARVGLSGRVIEDMYKIMALADYEDRFVIPTTHREQVEEAYDLRGGCGFTDTNGCGGGSTKGSLFGGSKKPLKMPTKAM